jgi:hypothetical protein
MSGIGPTAGHPRVVAIRDDTAATAHWTLMLIVRAFIDHAITIAVWTRFSFHGASSVLFQGGISTLIH